MKELTLNLATKQEIIDYYNSLKTAFIEPNISGELYRKESSIDVVVDNCIRQNISIVKVGQIESEPSPTHNGGITFYHYKRTNEKMFIIEDLAELRLNKFIEEVDNEELRNKKLDALRSVLRYEDNSKELYNKVVAAMKEFEGVSFEL